ncbi:endonuclease domain-containing protein [Caulobacter sp. KR2-114]|uniref:endonuclease domain-containing protein n=1 Tax=Caulobacter sp. KR2-114 TaxID=3400912 RepID=UPI003C0B4DBD
MPILKPRTRRARALRRNSTDAEHRLWAALRNRQLGGFKFRRQVPIDRYFADFACVEARLVVEVDGGQHAAQTAYDAARTARMQALGWRVIRFGTPETFHNVEGVALVILAVLFPDGPEAKSGAAPHPPTP